MSANVEAFKYFDNSFSLFETAEYYFPYADYVAESRRGLKIELEELFLQSEKERIKKEYPSLCIDGWKTYQQLGFVSKVTGCDWSSEQLFSFFMLWDTVERGIEKWTEVFKDAEKEKQLPLSGCNNLDHFLEKIFFWTLSCGVNDALYLDILNKSSTPTSSNAATGNEKDSEPSNPSFLTATFADYLTPYGQKILPFLVSSYSNAENKKHFAYMLYALYDLNANGNPLLNFELISNGIFNTNQSRLHKALKASFGSVGERQNLITHINNLKRASSEEERELEKHKDLIKKALQQSAEDQE